MLMETLISIYIVNLLRKLKNSVVIIYRPKPIEYYCAIA